MIFVCEKCDGDECMGKEVCEKARRAEKTPASYGSVSTSQMVCFMQPPIKSHSLAVLMWQFLFPSFHKSLWHPIKSNSITDPSQKKMNNNMPRCRKKWLTRAQRSVSGWRRVSVLAPSAGGWGERYDLWWEVRGGEGRGGGEGGEARRGDDYGHGPTS